MPDQNRAKERRRARYLADKAAETPEQRAIRLEKSKFINRAWYAQNRETHLANSQKYYQQNKPRKMLNVSAWKSRNSEKVKAIYDKYRLKNKARYAAHSSTRRARIRNASIDPTKISDWMISMRGRKRVQCYYCASSISGDSIHFDHIVPLVKGGRHEIGNLAASCQPCNSTKSASPLGKWNVKRGQQILSL